MKDHRALGRWHIEKQAKIKLSGAQCYTNCTIKDISLNGMQVCLQMRLPKDKFLKFNLVLGESCSLDVEAWVSWHRVIDGRNFYGFYFSHIKDQDKEKIYQFVRRNCSVRMDTKSWREEKEGGENMLDGPEFADRRVFERFSVRFPVRVLDTSSNQEGIAYTQDICAKGIGLLTKERLPVHNSLEMWLEIPDSGEPLYTRGKVAWSEPSGIEGYRVGINLEKADLMGLSRVLRVVH